MPPSATTEWEQLAGALHVWHVAPASLSSEVLEQQWRGRISAAEQHRLGQQHSVELRHVFLATRALCRAVLSSYAGVAPRQWAFGENEYGKPAVAGPAGFESLRFNLTHTSGLVACAVTRAGDVGVDAEETSRVPDAGEAGRMATHFLSPAEREALQALPPERRAARFLEYWVVKEAYLKGTGSGLSCPPESFTVGWDEGGDPLPLEDWQLALHRPTRRHVAATAVRSTGARVPVVWREFEGLGNSPVNRDA